MNIIAAVDQQWAIGKNNELLIRIPDDMKQFRRLTTGNVVVMGRKTLESFPNQAPLKDRVNIVLTKNTDYKVKGAIVVHSLEELQEELKQYDTKDVFVIGGGSIYEQLVDLCDTAYITKIDYRYEADAYMPNLEKDPAWSVTEESEEQTYFDVIYTYQIYKRG